MFGVYLEQWIGPHRPRLGWWRQHGPACFKIPGAQVSEAQKRILKTIGLTDEEVDGINFRWRVLPHPETVEVSEEPTFERIGGAA